MVDCGAPQVSPTPTDTEHSIATLRTICAIAGFEEDAILEQKDEVSHAPPPPATASLTSSKPPLLRPLLLAHTSCSMLLPMPCSMLLPMPCQ